MRWMHSPRRAAGRSTILGERADLVVRTADAIKVGALVGAAVVVGGTLVGGGRGCFSSNCNGSERIIVSLDGWQLRGGKTCQQDGESRRGYCRH